MAAFPKAVASLLSPREAATTPAAMAEVLSPSPDRSLVTAARGGDPIAFGRLFERYFRAVHGVLLSRVDKRDADDLVQDVFMIALQKLHQLEEPDAFAAWLAQIARNRATDHLRAGRRFSELSDDIPSADPRRSEAEQILVHIRALPEAYREPLILRLVEGLSGPEIAQRVGLRPDSVRVNLHRGLKLLRERLGHHE